LKLINDVICDVNNLLKHGNLLLVTNDTDFSAFQEKISSISTVDIKVNLSSNFLKQNKVALEDELHLNFV